MIKIGEKYYKYIIWDWLDTIFSKDDKEIFPWVSEYFRKYGLNTTNILVSWNAQPQKRYDLIMSHEIAKYFDDIEVTDGSKRLVFSNILKKYGDKVEEILVIGDNLDNEIKLAKEMGLDAYTPEEFKNLISSISIGSGVE